MLFKTVALISLAAWVLVPTAGFRTRPQILTQVQGVAPQTETETSNIPCEEAVSGAMKRSCTFGCKDGEVCKCHKTQKLTGQNSACRIQPPSRKFNPAHLEGKGCVCQEVYEEDHAMANLFSVGRDTWDTPATGW